MIKPTEYDDFTKKIQSKVSQLKNNEVKFNFKVNSLKKQIKDLDAEEMLLQSECEDLIKENEELKIEIGDLQVEVSDRKKEIDYVVQKFHIKKTSEMLAYEEKIKSHANDIMVHKAAADKAVTDQAAFEGLVTQLKDKANEHEAEIAKHAAAVAEAKAGHAGKDAEMKDLQNQIDATRKKHGDLQYAHADAIATKNAHQAAIYGHLEKKGELERKSLELQTQVDAHGRELNGHAADIDAYKLTHSNNEAANARAQQEHDAQVAKLQKQLEDMKNGHKASASDIAAMESKLTAAKNDHSSLHAQIAKHDTLISGHENDKTILDQRKIDANNKLKGLQDTAAFHDKAHADMMDAHQNDMNALVAGHQAAVGDHHDNFNNVKMNCTGEHADLDSTLSSHAMNNEHLSRLVDSHKDTLATITAKVNDKHAEVVGVETRNAELTLEIEDAQRRVKNKQEKMSIYYDQMNKMKNSHDGKMVELAQLIMSHKNDILKHEQGNAAFQAEHDRKLAEYTSKIEHYGRQIDSIVAKTNIFQEAHLENTAALRDAKRTRADHERNIDFHESEINRIGQHNKQITGALDKLADGIAGHTSDIHGHKTAFESMKQNLDGDVNDMEGKLAAASAALEDLQGQHDAHLDAHGARLDEHTKKVAVHKGKYDKLKKDLTDLESENANIDDNIGKLEDLINQLVDEEASNPNDEKKLSENKKVMQYLAFARVASFILSEDDIMEFSNKNNLGIDRVALRGQFDVLKNNPAKLGM